MHYVIWGAAELPADVARTSGAQALAGGDMLVLEGPWPLGPTALAYLADDKGLAAFRAKASATSGAFAVEGLAAPDAGGAFVVAAHRMLDPDGFRPYADAIPDLLRRFGARVLARGGTITHLAGDFAPDRGVVLEFASAEAAVAFYTSEVYAPLLRLRWRTTDPRFVILTRAGTLPAALRARAEDFLRAHGRQAAG